MQRLCFWGFQAASPHPAPSPKTGYALHVVSVAFPSPHFPAMLLFSAVCTLLIQAPLLLHSGAEDSQMKRLFQPWILRSLWNLEAIAAKPKALTGTSAL